MQTLATLILCSSVAFAGCANGYPTISEEYSNSVTVLVGKVVAHRATPFSGDEYFLDGETYTVVPLHTLKGNPGSKVDLFSENSSGRFPMHMEREYLLFVYEDHGRLMVDSCGNSDLMPHAKNALVQTAEVAAHGSDSQAALDSLRTANPAVDWSASSAKTADFDCDEKADTVMLGSEKGRVVVGLVWASPKKHPQILSFPIGTPTQDGFRQQPKTIDTLPLDCKDEAGRKLPGCKTTPACRAFALRDDDTDIFNFYWDSSHVTLRWWRQ
jgi:hypothetical protein